VIGGYALSSAIRPLMGIAQSWTQVFAIRFIDRIGKGIRGAPRDALLAMLATPATRGRVYGFHRGMDHAGAVVGPVLASLFLIFYPNQYRTLFALTLFPGAIAVALILLVREPEAGPSSVATLRDTRSLGPRHLESPAVGRGLSRFLLVLSIFTLGNSTDAFLLLKLTDAAGSAQLVPLMWAALHVVKAAVSFVAGAWSDRVGRRSVIGIGWCVYAIVYVGFALSASLPALLLWFLVYGFYFGFAEGTEKALVADLTPPANRGYAFGLYTAVQGMGSLAASLLFGALWTLSGPAVAFVTGALLAIVATVLLFTMVPAGETYN
jgi:MFS family permease